jgi:hypothetical protein
LIGFLSLSLFKVPPQKKKQKKNFLITPGNKEKFRIGQFLMPTTHPKFVKTCPTIQVGLVIYSTIKRTISK